MGFRKSTCGIFPRGNNRYLISAGLGVLSSANHYAYMPRTLVLDFPDCTELGPDHTRAASATLAMLMIPQANLQDQVCCGSICCHNPSTCELFQIKTDLAHFDFVFLPGLAFDFGAAPFPEPFAGFLLFLLDSTVLTLKQMWRGI